MKINARLKELRKALNLSQAEFGDKIGLKQGAISWMEQPGNTITAQNIKLICEKFSVNRDWLTNGQGEMFCKSDHRILHELAEQYNLNELQLATIKAFLLLSTEEMEVILKLIKNAAAAIEAVQENEIDAEVEAYRQELLARKKGTQSSASGTGKETIAK